MRGKSEHAGFKYDVEPCWASVSSSAKWGEWLGHLVESGGSLKEKTHAKSWAGYLPASKSLR